MVFLLIKGFICKKCRQPVTAFSTYFLFSQDWLATPQLVLQADWQEVWHSPQPPLAALWQRLRVSKV